MAEPQPTPPPDQEPDQLPPHSDWLRTVARATETVAPLVKPVAPDPENLPQDRRGRWAAVLASFSILVAVTKFVLDFFNLVSRPIAPLAAALPTVAGVLFVTGFGACVYVAWRARTPARRRRFAGAAALIAVIGMIWGGWTIFEALRPPAGFRILVAEFDGERSGQQVDFARRITDQLRTELATIGVPIEIRRALKSYADAESARSDGAQQKAGMVIWGWYDDLGVSPHVEVLTVPGAPTPAPAIPILFATASAAGASDMTLAATLDNIAVVAHTPPALPAVDLYAKYGPDQMTYVTAAVLGLSYLANGDTDQARSLFDKALASVAGAPTGGQGQELVLYQRALLNYQAGDLPAARTDLDAALALRPDFYEAVSLLAIVLADGCAPGRDLAAALAAAETAATLQAEDAAAWRLLVDLRLRSGDASGAVAAAQQAQQHAPNDAATHVALAAALQAAGQTAEAATAARSAEAGLPQSAGGGQAAPQIWFDLGNVYLQQANWAAATAAYQRGLALAPGDARGQVGIGRVLHKQGRLDEAEAHFRAWLATAPTAAMPHVMLGLLLNERGATAEALAELRAADSLASCSPDAAMFEGTILFGENDLTGAESALRRALSVEPGNPLIELSLGATLLMQGRAAEAVPLLESAVARQPGLLHAHYALGQSYKELGEPKPARAAFAELVAQAGASPQPSLELAVAYEEIDQPQAAIDVYRGMLAQEESADVHVYLAELYAQIDEGDQAFAELQAALALEPQQPLALLALGNLLTARGDQAGAVAAFEQYAALQDSATVRVLMAQLYEGLGQPGRAAQALARAAELEPENADIPRAQAELASGQGNLAEAENYLDQAMRLRPDDPALHAARSNLAYQRCNLDRAVLEMERTVALAPDDATNRGILALRYLAQGRPEAAAPIAAALQAASDSDFMAHLLAGSLLANGGDLRNAEAELRVAASVAETEPLLLAIAQAGLGEIYQQQGDLAAARAGFAAAIASSAAYAPALAGLGDVALEEGQPAAALASYGAANAALDAYGSVFGGDQAQLLAIFLASRRSLALAAAGDEAGAAQAQTAAEAQAHAALAANPDWPDAHFALGLVLAGAGQDEQAAVEFDAAAACDTTFVQRRTTALALLQRLMSAQ